MCEIWQEGSPHDVGLGWVGFLRIRSSFTAYDKWKQGEAKKQKLDSRNLMFILDAKSIK